MLTEGPSAQVCCADGHRRYNMTRRHRKLLAVGTTWPVGTGPGAWTWGIMSWWRGNGVKLCRRPGRRPTLSELYRRPSRCHIFFSFSFCIFVLIYLLLSSIYLVIFCSSIVGIRTPYRNYVSVIACVCILSWRLGIPLKLMCVHMLCTQVWWGFVGYNVEAPSVFDYTHTYTLMVVTYA
jgi:hypothetical protein